MKTEEYNAELKLNWRPRWLSSINELTDLELQKISWLDAKVENPHWTYVEFMCSYLNDLGLENNYKDPLERKLITTEELQIIMEWHKKLTEYEAPNKEHYNHTEILNDSKWTEILKLGLNSRLKLADIICEEEKKILTEKINYLAYT